MSLSSGTLNLKFMQRAAARNAANSASSAGADATSGSAAGPSTHRPANPTGSPASIPISSNRGPTSGTTASNLTAVSDQTRTPQERLSLKAEADAQWFLRRKVGRPNPQAGTDQSKGSVLFETSYLPFLGPTSTTDASDEAGPSRRAGGGRMAFGGFGEATKPDGFDDSEGDDEPDARRRVHGLSGRHEHGSANRGEKRKLDSGESTSKDEIAAVASSPAVPRHVDESTGFVRPANYSPAVASTSSTGTGHRPKSKSETDRRGKPTTPGKPSRANALRQTISASRANAAPSPFNGSGIKREAPDSTTSSAASNGPSPGSRKKIKVDPSLGVGVNGPRAPEVQNNGKNQDTWPGRKLGQSSGGGSLDDREKAMKAAKKKEKKARQKAAKIGEESAAGAG